MTNYLLANSLYFQEMAWLFEGTFTLQVKCERKPFPTLLSRIAYALQYPFLLQEQINSNTIRS